MYLGRMKTEKGDELSNLFNFRLKIDGINDKDNSSCLRDVRGHRPSQSMVTWEIDNADRLRSNLKGVFVHNHGSNGGRELVVAKTVEKGSLSGVTKAQKQETISLGCTLAK
jgi:hypothetical protein